jgi:hypothetical protein
MAVAMVVVTVGMMMALPATVRWTIVVDVAGER